MWTKTITTKFQKQVVQVQIWLHDSNELGQEVVRMQSMVSEYYLINDIMFPDRDSAYDFIRTVPVSMAHAFVVREAYSAGANNPNF